MFKNLSVATSLTLLAACGGSSSGPVIVPLSPSGFASDTVRTGTVSTLNLVDQRRITSVGGEELTLEVQDIILDDLDDQDGEAIVTINGQEITLVRQTPGRFVYEDGDDFAVLQFQISDFPNAEVATLFSVLNDNLNTSNIVIGVDTDPAVIGARIGGAEYEGGISLTTRTGFIDGFGAGRIALDVDFDAMTLGGDLFVFDDGGDNPEVRVPSVAFDIDPTDIAGNGFETTLTYDEDASLGEIDGTIISAGITGRFYGPDGGAVGGQIFGEIDNGEGEFPTLVEGAYVATE